MDDVIEKLWNLIAVAERHDPRSALLLRNAIGLQLDADQFFNDGNVWGRMGSVIDSLAVTCPSGREGRRECEQAVIQLADALTTAGHLSPMVDKWAEIFRHWRQLGT